MLEPKLPDAALHTFPLEWQKVDIRYEAYYFKHLDEFVVRFLCIDGG